MTKTPEKGHPVLDKLDFREHLGRVRSVANVFAAPPTSFPAAARGSTDLRSTIKLALHSRSRAARFGEGLGEDELLFRLALLRKVAQELRQMLVRLP